MLKLVKTQPDSKHFRNSAIISGLPKHFTRLQVSAIFSQWPVASVILTTRSCAFIDFFDPNASYQAKTFYDNNKFKDSETNVEYKITVCPIQSRHLRSQPSTTVEVIESTKEKKIPFRDTANNNTQTVL